MSQVKSSPAQRERNQVLKSAKIIQKVKSIHRFALSSKLGLTVTQYAILHPNLEFQLMDSAEYDKPTKMWNWTGPELSDKN